MELEAVGLHRIVGGDGCMVGKIMGMEWRSLLERMVSSLSTGKWSVGIPQLSMESVVIGPIMEAKG
jgi:hypothetical protein